LIENCGLLTVYATTMTMSHLTAGGLASITGPPGIALATDRQEDRLQAVPVGPQGIDQASADVHRRHVDTCLQSPVTELSVLSHQR